MKKIELIVKTSMVVGIYQHQVCEKGMNAGNRYKFELSNEIVKAQEKVNEMIYEKLQEKINRKGCEKFIKGFENLVISRIKYKVKP